MTPEATSSRCCCKAQLDRHFAHRDGRREATMAPHCSTRNGGRYEIEWIGWRGGGETVRLGGNGEIGAGGSRIAQQENPQEKSRKTKGQKRCSGRSLTVPGLAPRHGVATIVPQPHMSIGQWDAAQRITAQKGQTDTHINSHPIYVVFAIYRHQGSKCFSVELSNSSID
jgi:hypothetical protein